jgi:hypothetical protein
VHSVRDNINDSSKLLLLKDLEEFDTT